MTNEKFGLGLK